MEISIKCPDCGKTLKVIITDEANKIKNIKSFTKETNWSEIAKQIKSGKAKENFAIGDKIPFTLKNGSNVCAVVAAIEPYNKNEVIFCFDDCISRYNMNEHSINKGGWRDCEMRKYLNTEIYDLLPDELKSVISYRTIVQSIDDDAYISVDKLWLPSKTELGGESNVDIDDVKFPLFNDEKSRVKQIDGEPVCWWERSPYLSHSTTFWIINHSGGYYTVASAPNTYGVCPCFSIRDI